MKATPKPTQALHDLGQSLWLDNITRDLLTSGTLELWAASHEAKTYDDPMLDELKQKLIDARKAIEETVQLIKPKGNSYLDLCARKSHH